MKLLFILHFLLINQKVVNSELFSTPEIAHSIFHFSFLPQGGNENTATFMEKLLMESNTNSIPLVVIEFPIQNHRLVDLPRSAYKSGPILYFIQADFETPTKSITNLIEFFKLVPKNNRDNFHIWISPKRTPIGEYRRNGLQENIHTVRLMMVKLFGCLFHVSVPSKKKGGRVQVNAFSITTGEFVPAEESSSR